MEPSLILSDLDYQDLFTPLVYGWKRNNKYLYIGSTANGFRRILAQHRIINKIESILPGDEIVIWKTPNYIELEMQLINMHQPKYNKYNLVELPKKVLKEIVPKPVTPPEKIRCDYCKGLFTPDRKWQHFCSEKCRNGWHNDKRAIEREKKRKN